MSTSSIRCSGLNEDEKAGLKASREDQLREIFREAILKDLLTIYTTPYSAHGDNPVGELLNGLDVAVGIDRRRIFLEVLKESITLLEAEHDEGNPRT
jgi:hypothetical protein